MTNFYKRSDLEELIESYLGESLSSVIRKQISKFAIEEDMSFKEIARCVSYYVENEGKEISPLYGIWFVPIIRNRAAAYFKQLELDQQRQKEEAKKIVEYQDNNIIFNIKSLKNNKRKPKQLDMNDINIKGEDND